MTGYRLTVECVLDGLPPAALSFCQYPDDVAGEPQPLQAPDDPAPTLVSKMSANVCKSGPGPSMLGSSARRMGSRC